MNRLARPTPRNAARIEALAMIGMLVIALILAFPKG